MYYQKKDQIQTTLRSYLCLHMPNIPTEAAGSIQNGCQASTPNLCDNREGPQNKQTKKPPLIIYNFECNLRVQAF